MAYKMKGHSLPGPHQRKSPAKQGFLWNDKIEKEARAEIPGLNETKIEKDRREKRQLKPGESRYQADVRRGKEGKARERKMLKTIKNMGPEGGKRYGDVSKKKKSPAKIAPLLVMGAQMLGKKMMEKKQEKDSPTAQLKPLKTLIKKLKSKPKTKMLKGTTVFGKTISERNKAFPFGQGPKIKKYAKKLRTGIQKLNKQETDPPTKMHKPGHIPPAGPDPRVKKKKSARERGAQY